VTSLTVAVSAEFRALWRQRAPWAPQRATESAEFRLEVPAEPVHAGFGDRLAVWTPTAVPTTPPSSTSRDGCWATKSSLLTVTTTAAAELAAPAREAGRGRVEGTGSYGAGLTHYLLDQHVAEINSAELLTPVRV
jgi:hypothetical protein